MQYLKRKWDKHIIRSYIVVGSAILQISGDKNKVVFPISGKFEWNWHGYLHQESFRTNPGNKLIIEFMGNWQIKLESYTFQALNTNINYNSTNYLGGDGILNFFKIKIRFLAAMAILGLIIFKYYY